MSQVRVSDTDWIRRSFQLPRRATGLIDRRRTLMSTASQKFSDTTLGGNAAVNCAPQFTPTADLRIKGRNNRSSGIGRYYSEAHDDTGVILHLRAGMPQYNSILKFWSGAFNYRASTLAATGRHPGLFYNLGRIVGFIVTIPIQPIIFGVRGISYLLLGTSRSTRYYNLKPAMPLYWTAVQKMVNAIAVNMGVVPPSTWNDGVELFRRSGETNNNINEVRDTMDAINDGQFLTSEEVNQYHDAMPDIFRRGGGIDVYAVANRYQRLLDAHNRSLIETVSGIQSNEALSARMREFQTELEYVTEQTDELFLFGEQTNGVVPLTAQPGMGYEDYMAAWADIEAGRPTEAGEEANENSSGGVMESMWSWLSDFGTFAGANRRDGSDFVRFNVKMRDSVSESVSNSTKDSEIAGTINSMTTSSRNRNFTFAGGNLGDNVVIEALEGMVGAAQDFVAGGLDSVGLGGIANAVLGSAFTDIPQQYESSTFSLPTINFKLELRTPYDHPLARLLYEIVPMCMVWALGMPRQAGSQAWREPFIVEGYCQGRFQCRLGIVDQITVTRAVNNLPYNYEGGYKGIDIDVSIKDLSSMVAMPIVHDTTLFAEDNAFSDLMAVYGSMSLGDQIYASKRLKFQITRQLLELRTWSSASSRASWFAGTLPGRVIQNLSRVDP